ncbi:MAG: hypothetical protein CBD63_02025 [Candidatus Pelagibacter sp. TMED203]|nr:MAG: hypothetical protein CBD63_02025 [Candidatus Pelagibacter sp. TMED203]
MKKEIFPITLILILALSRLIPHPPNFTPIIAVAILSGYFFKNLYLSFLVLITSMIVADFFIGFYDNMLVTYMTLILISLTFYKVGSKLNYKNLFLFSLFGSLIFFIITNFGVWALGSLYEKNLKGLIECYILAIPFFGNTFLSTLVFAYPSIFIHKKVASLSIAR